MLLASNIIIVIFNNTWIIFPQSSKSLPTKSVFERILTKVLCQYILNRMSKKKLGSFNDLIKAFFQSFICLLQYEHFLVRIFCKVSLTLLKRIQPILERLKENITKPWQPSIIEDLSGANIGIHSNSRNLLFWMFMISKINPLLNERVQFWKDMKTAFYIFIKNSRNAIPKYEHIIATHLLSTFTFTWIVQTLLCWFHRMFVVWNIRNKGDKTFVRTK